MSSRLLSKNHICYSSSGIVKEICKPLFNILRINYFSFYRIYTNGDRIRLCSNPEILEKYYEEGWYETSAFERITIPYYDTCVIWSSMEEGYRVCLEKQLYELYKLNDMISIIKTQSNYVDIYDFSTSEANVNLNSIFLQQMNILERFTQYFNVSASNLIQQAMKERFKLPLKKDKNQSDTQRETLETLDLNMSNRMKEFYRLTIPQYLCLPTEEGETALSQRETECLVNSIQGLSAKQIAQRLKISYRTVETHIANIKNKSGYSSMNKLIEAALSSKTILYFLNDLRRNCA